MANKRQQIALAKREQKALERRQKERRRQEIAMYKREHKARAKEQIELQRLIAGLIEMLQSYLKLHYGDPATGRIGATLDGPTMARLTSASALRALLLEISSRPKTKSAKDGA